MIEQSWVNKLHELVLTVTIEQEIEEVLGLPCNYVYFPSKSEY